VAAAANLASGTDDHANATDTQWVNALNLFGADLGPGQVSQVGRTTTQAHTDTIAHAYARNRFAILDGPDTAVKATLAAAPDAVDSLTGSRRGAMYAPWVNVAGSAPGTTKTVPPSAVVAGRTAVTDSLAGVNQPPAGEYGISVTGLSVTATFTDTDAQELGAPDSSSLTRGAVNLLRVRNGQVVIYGDRTVAEKTANPLHWMASNERLDMQIKAEAGVIGDSFLFRQIDGGGLTLGAWRGQLEAMLNRFYLAGSLYADATDPRAETAYYVDVGAQVNTPTTLANGELHAVLSVRMSPFAELVQIQVVKVPITQTVA
jgi:phage tail sheath protein FI